MSETQSPDKPRPVRVDFPAQVEFAGEKFQIEEFTANLSIGGIFLPTDRVVAPGTRGKLTFRISQWEEPFTVQAEVVRGVSVGVGEETKRQPGLGMRFLGLSEVDRRRLQRLVDGVRDGSVVETIRRSLRESGRTLTQELRRRPIDQKLMLAMHAQREELEALIQDANPVVVQRLLRNPRLRVPHVRAIVRDPRTGPTILLAIKKQRDWMSDEDVPYLFCKHPRVPIHELPDVLPQLPVARLQQLAREATLHPQARQKIKELLRKR